MDILDLFIRQLASKDKSASKSTVKNYGSDIRHFINWYEKSLKSIFEANSVSSDIISLYEKSQGGIINGGDLDISSKLSVASMKRHMSSLRKFFAFLAEEGIIPSNPFNQIQPPVNDTPTDYWHIRSFRDFLASQKVSKITSKNYISDILGFAKWYEQAILPTLESPLASKGGFYLITQSVLNDYKNRLSDIQNAAPRTINRKLSALRRYLDFASKKGFIDISELSLDPVVVSQNRIEEEAQPQIRLSEIKSDEPKKPTYSKFPPIRLLQRLIVFPYLGFEDKAAGIIASIIAGKPVEGLQKLPQSVTRELGRKNYLRAENINLSSILGVRGIQKEFYQPNKVSLLGQPLHKKIIHHARFSRPSWYHKYHSYAFVHYAHFALLIIFASGVGIALYTNLVGQKQREASAAPTAPPRILSFQGRLTDNLDNPITTPTDIRFSIYNDPTASGAALLWQEVQYLIAPDQDGIFSVLLGSNTTIPSTVFSDNSSIYLGVTIRQTSELTPRQRVASVGYATNAEFLQGLPPTTQAGITSFTNVVLALDSSGNLTLSDSSPADHTFQVSNGTFKLSGQPLLLSTNTGSDGNVVISPDGLGKIDLQKGLVNTTLNGNISPGAVEVNDKFAVLATESAVAAFIVNNNTAGGDIFTASSSGTPRFTVQNDGTLVSGIYTGQNGVLYGTQTNGIIAQTTTASSGLCLQSGLSSPTWGSCGGAGYWNLTDGALAPIHNSVDVLFGGQATASAKFRFINNISGTPVASISANSGNNALFVSGDGTLGTTNRQSLTIGNSSTYNTTGNLLINPNGIGRIGIYTATPLASFDLRGISGTQVAASISATTTAPALLIDNSGTGDFIAASKGGQIYFRVNANSGNWSGFDYDGELIVGKNGAGKITADVVDPIVVGNQKTSGIQSLTLLTMGSTNADVIFQNISTELGRLTQAGQFRLPIQGSTGGILFGGDAQIFRGAADRLDLASGDSFNVVSGNIQIGGVTRIDSSGNGFFTNLTVTSCSGCISASNSPFQILNGAIVPLITSTDFLLGAQSTTSAKFAVLNINNGTPTASVSSGLSGNGMYLTADGTLATAKRQTLTIGNSSTYNTTGNVLINPNGTGNVGIGTTSPSYQFHVSDPNSAGTSNLIIGGQFQKSVDNRYVINIKNTNANPSANAPFAGISAEAHDSFTGAYEKALFGLRKRTNGGSNGETIISAPNNFALYAGRGLDYDTYSNYGTLALYVATSSGGLVGINTTSPDRYLDILDASNPQLRLSQADSSVYADFQMDNNGDLLINVDGASNQLVLDNGGNVGIGTATPAQKFVVYGASAVNRTQDSSGNYNIDLYANGSGPRINFGDVDTASNLFLEFGAYNSINQIDTKNRDFHIYGTNTTTGLYFDESAGTFGLGTTTPTAKLDVSGSASISGALKLYGTPTIQSTANQTLTIGGDTTGNITLSPLNGSGTIMFTNFSTAGGLLYTNSSGVLSQTGAGSGSQCLLGGTTPTWGSCSTGGTDSPFYAGSGFIAQNNTTLDLLLGGTATTSAKFAVLNVNGTGPATATVSGNLIVMPNNGAGGNVGIGTATPGYQLTLANSGSSHIRINADTDNATETDIPSLQMSLDGGTLGLTMGIEGIAETNFTGSLANTPFLESTNTSYGLQLVTGNQAGVTLTSTVRLGVGTVSPTSHLHITRPLSFGATGKALAIFDQIESQDILTASSSGTTRFKIANNGDISIYDDADINDYLTISNSGTNTTLARVTDGGTLGNVTIDSNGTLTAENLTGTSSLTVSAFNTNGGLLYTNGSGLFAQTGAGSGSQCLLGGTTPTWGSCAAGGTDSPFYAGSGFIAQNNTTLDLLLGGTATTSAKFAVLNVNSGTPVASISANSGNNALYVTGDGTLATTNRGNLTIGNSSTYNTTGNVLINPNGTGNVGIGTTNPDKKLVVKLSDSSGVDEFKILDSAGSTIFTIDSDGNTLWPSTMPTVNFNNANTIGFNDIDISDPGVGEGFGWSGTSPGWIIDVSPIDRSNADGNLNLYGTAAGVNNSIAFWRPTMWVADAGSVATASASTTGLNFTTSLNGNITFNPGGYVGVGTTGPDAPLDVLSTGGTQLRLTYADGSTYTNFNTNTNGDLTIAPSGGDSNITGTLDVSGNAAFGSNGAIATDRLIDIDTTTTTAQGSFHSIVNSSVANAAITSVYGLHNRVDVGASGVINDLFGIYAVNPTNSGSVTSNYGIYVGDQTAGTSDYGLAIAGADTQALWVGSGANNTDAANGIAFGSSRDTNLYRSAADTLKTDDAFNVNGNLNITSAGAISAATGLTSSGTITFSGFSTNGGLLYTNGSGVLAQTGAGSGSQCLLGGTTPTFGSCSTGGTDSPFQVLSGSIVPLNSTQDFLIGGQATSSAKFAVLNVNGTGPATATVSGNLIVMPNNGAGGNVGIGTTTPTAKLDVSGRTTKFSNQYPVYRWYWGGSNGDNDWKNIANITNTGVTIYDGYSFSVKITNMDTNAGSSDTPISLQYYASIRGSLAGDNAVVSGPIADYVRVIKTATDVYELQVRQIANWKHMQVEVQGLSTCCGAPKLTYVDSPVDGSTSGTVYSAATDHTDYATNFYIGGSALTFAQATTVNIANSSTTALNFESGLFNLDSQNSRVGIGTISPTAKLDIAGDASTSGSLVFNGSNKSIDILNGSRLDFQTSPGGDSGLTNRMTLLNNGNFGIGGDTTPDSLLSVGSTSQFQVNSSGAIAAATGLTSSGTITFSGFTGANNGGVIFANASGVLSQTAAGSGSQCLLGGTTPAWGSCAAGGTDSPFYAGSGFIAQNNTTLDLLLGGTATTSAKFAVLNINNGTPTASVSATGVTDRPGLYMTGTGTLSSVNKGTLTIGSSDTGNIVIGTDSTARNISIGNTTGASAVNFNTGTGGSLFTTTGAGDFTVTSGDDVVINGGGASAAISIGTAATAHTIVIGNETGATSLELDSGTGAINIGNAIAKTINIGNITGGTALNLLTGTGGINIGDGTPTKTIDIGGNDSSASDTIRIATHATASDTISIGNAHASTTVTITGGTAWGVTSGGDLTVASCTGCGGADGSSNWTLSGGVLRPNNNTVDFVLGGTGTSSAKFAVINMNGTGPATATVSGNLIVMPNNGAGGYVGIGTSNPTALLALKGKVSEASYGSDKVTNGTFTGSATSWILGTDWTYSSNSVSKAPGTSTSLEQDVSAVAGETYEIVFTISNSANDTGYITPQIGGTVGIPVYGNSTNQTQVITAADTTNLKFTSSTGFEATIDNVSVRKINKIDSIANYNNADNSTGVEFRSGGIGLNNTFVGIGSGQYNSSGYQNTAFGTYSLSNNLTGYMNTAIGYNTMVFNTTGRYNTALGDSSLYQNTSGTHNVALGLQALYTNSTGQLNVALGNNSLYSNTHGSVNIAIGNNPLYSNTSGFSNIAIGQDALGSLIDGQQNTALGHYALEGSTGSFNTALGESALPNHQTGDGNTAVGQGADSGNISGHGNTALGNATYTGVSGNYNIAIGYTAGWANTTYNNQSGSNNIYIGYNSGPYSVNATFNNSAAIGAFALVNASNALVLGGTSNSDYAVNVGIGTATPSATLDIQGGNRGGNAALIVNQLGSSSNNILTASSSGTTRFTIANNGTITASAYTTNGGLFYANGSGVLSQTGAGSGSQCLLGGTTPTWGSCGGSGGGVFDLANGVITPGNMTADLLWGGTATLSARFHLYGNINAGTNPTASISGKTSNASLIVNNDGVGDIFVASTSGNTVFVIDRYGDQWIWGTQHGPRSDFAEYYKKANPTEELLAGQLICLVPNGVTKCTSNNPSQKLIGVISDNALIAGNSAHANDPGYALVGMVGQLGVWVTGDVKAGDPLTYSSTPGFAVKATSAGNIIGYAQKDNNGAQMRVDSVIQPTFYDPDFALHNPNIFDSLSLEIQNGIYSVRDAFGNSINSVNAFSKLLVANITAGFIDAQSIVTKSLALTTNNFTIAGQSISSYVENIVADYLASNSQLLTPIAQTDQVLTNIISPLADSSAPSLELRNSQISILSSGETVSWFDSNGNASFSGTLTSGRIETNDASISGELVANSANFQTSNSQLLTAGEATVSGTLRTNNLIADNIQGLDDKIGTLAAVLNGSYQPQGSGSGEFSNLFAGVVNATTITADFGIFEQGITSMGPITASHITAIDTLVVGSNLTISNNAINTLGAELALQSLRQADITFQGGLIRMDTDGNMNIAGNLNLLGEIDAVHGVFSGTVSTPALATSIISPLAGDDLTIKLTDKQASEGSKLRITDNQNKEVLSVDNKGNIISSGSATLSKLNFNLVGEAQASSLTEAIATGSAGFATLRANQPEITIKNPNVTEKSLIYITPFGDTDNKVLYLLRQIPQTEDEEGSFTVGASGTLPTQNIQFNWLIVN